MNADSTPTSRSIFDRGDFFKASMRYLRRLDYRPKPLSTSATSLRSMLRSYLSFSKYAKTIISGAAIVGCHQVAMYHLTPWRCWPSLVSLCFGWSGQRTQQAGREIWTADYLISVATSEVASFVAAERARRSILEATVPRFPLDDCFSIRMAHRPPLRSCESHLPSWSNTTN
jgi:hypothetical protein